LPTPRSDDFGRFAREVERLKPPLPTPRSDDFSRFAREVERLKPPLPTVGPPAVPPRRGEAC
ncbi:MAG: hypothetical protein KDE23_16470, partial [Caldilinea sp.]|nr:hypothetical protein [Caldilinea sp.]